MTDVADRRPGLRRLLLVPALLGATAVVTGVWWGHCQLAAKHRPSVAGTVVDVSRFFVTAEDNALFTVRYRYAVNGVAYERAERLFTMTDRDGRHPMGMHDWVLRPSIEVYYDRSNPARATIEAGLQTEPMVLVVLGSLLLGIPMAAQLRRWRMSSRAIRL